MKKRMVLVVIPAILLATSAYAPTPDLFSLVEIGTPQDVQAAIDKGADVNARSAPGLFGGMTPLMRAAWNNPNPAMITTLLKAGADIEARDLAHGMTALMFAAERNNAEVVTTLLKAGADANARNNNGRTALISSVYEDENPAEVIVVLLNAGADAKVKDRRGKTALDYAHQSAKLKGTDALKRLEEASK